jgi:hypothetical protein
VEVKGKVVPQGTVIVDYEAILADKQDKRNRRSSQINRLQCHFVHHKSHMNSRRNGPEAPQPEASV